MSSNVITYWVQHYVWLVLSVNEWPTQTEVVSITGRQLALRNVLFDLVYQEVNEHSAKLSCKNMLNPLVPNPAVDGFDPGPQPGRRRL